MGNQCFPSPVRGRDDRFLGNNSTVVVTRTVWDGPSPLDISLWRFLGNNSTVVVTRTVWDGPSPLDNAVAVAASKKDIPANFDSKPWTDWFSRT